jgi:hypothetical protein
MMEDVRESEADATLTATYIHHLLMPSKMPTSGACPDDFLKHAGHVGVSFLLMDCKGRGSHCCSERGACSRWSLPDKTREYRSGVWLVAQRKHGLLAGTGHASGRGRKEHGVCVGLGDGVTGCVRP